jgi:ribose 5-phosphate isomerase
MTLWNKIKEKEQTQTQHEVTDNGERVLYLINNAFGLPDELKDKIIKAIDEVIDEGLSADGMLDYLKVVESACENYSPEQVEDAYAHQLLGAYITYAVMTGKPLKLK